jgi:hypothetical protein
LVVRGDIGHKAIALCEVSLVIQKVLAIVQRFSEVAQDLVFRWGWLMYWIVPLQDRRLILCSLYKI